MNTPTSADSIRKKPFRSPVIYYVFLAWTFVFMGRPQDIFTFLNPLRPALTLGVLTLLLAIIQRSRLGSCHFLKSSQGKIYATLLCVMALSIPFAYYRGSAFKFLFADYVNVVIFAVLFYRLVDSVTKIEQILFVVCLGSGLYSLAALLKGAAIGSGRFAFGTVFDSNDLAYFAISFLPLNLLFVSRENPYWKRLLAVGNILTSVLLILKTGSRGGFVASCLVACAILFARTQIIKRSYKIIIVTLGLLVIFSALSTIDFSRFRTITEIGSDYNVWDETGRMSIWKRGFDLMFSHPLTGVGVSCFEEAIGKDRLQAGLREIWQAPHNSLIQIGAETGVMGLALFVLLSYYTFKIFRHSIVVNSSQQLSMIGGIAAISFLGNFTAAMFLSQAYSIYWAFFIALSASMQNLIMEDKSGTETLNST